MQLSGRLPLRFKVFCLKRHKLQRKLNGGYHVLHMLPFTASQAIPAAALMLFHLVTTTTLSSSWRFCHPFLSNCDFLASFTPLLCSMLLCVLGEDGMLVPAIRYCRIGPGMHCLYLLDKAVIHLLRQMTCHCCFLQQFPQQRNSNKLSIATFG